MTASTGPLPAAVALATLPLPVWIYDARLTLAFANPAAWALAGLGDAALPVGTPIAAVVQRLAYAGVFGAGDPRQLIERHLALPLDRPLRRLLRHADGRVFDLYRSPLPQGGFVTVLADVTQHGAAAAAALGRAHQIERAFGALGTGMALLDADDRLVLTNPAFAALAGFPPEVLAAGAPWADALRRLADLGEFSNADTEAVVAERLGLDRTRSAPWERERPNGQVLRHLMQPVGAGQRLLEITDITAMRGAEEEAQRRAGLLDGVLAALPHGVVAFGPDGRVVLANAAFQRIMRGAEVTIGEHRDAIAHRRAAGGEYGPGDPAALAAAAIAWLATDRAPLVRRRPDGSVVETGTASLPDGGRVQVATDITELAHAREDAQRRAEVLGFMLDSMRHGIALFDADRRLVAVNALTARVAGIDAAKVRPGLTLEEVVAQQLAAGEFDAAAAQRATERDRSVAFAYRRRRPDGSEIDVTSDPTPDGGFIVTYSDVTARLRAEVEAARRAALLQAMLDHSRHGIALYDADHRLIAANAEFAQSTSLPMAALRPGRRFVELLAEQAVVGGFGVPAMAQAAMARSLHLDRTQPQRGRRALPDGRTIEVGSDPLPEGGFVVTHVDVTALAQAEAEAEARAALLRTTLDHMQHGILLFGADQRVRVANRLAAQMLGPEAGFDPAPGTSFAALVARQLAAGVFGTDAAAAATAAALVAADRAAPLRYERRMPDGRRLGIASDPTPDGGFVITHTDLTDLLDAETTAADRLAMLQATLDAMRHGIALFGPDRRLRLANDLALELIGLPEGAVPVGIGFDTIIAGQLARGDIDPDYAQSVQDCDRSRPMRWTRIRADGTALEVISHPAADGGFVVTFTDVTALRQLEAEARRRADILQVMLDHTRHGICYFGADRRVVTANVLAARFGGHAPGVVEPGRSLEALIEDQLRTGAIGSDARALATLALGMDRTRPYRYVRPARDGRMLEVTSDPTPDGGFVVTQSDVTALLHAEAEAKRRAEIQQVMLDRLRDGVLLVDPAGRIVASNPALLLLLDLPEGLVVPGMTHAQFIALLAARGEYGPDPSVFVATETAADRTVARRIERTRPDGRHLAVASEPTPDGGFMLTWTDVSEDRRIRAELEQAKLAAEAANRAKSRFLATMSHELRTPLNAVIGFSEAVRAEAEPARREEFLGAIHEAGRHLLGLIDDILEVARSETTGVRLAVAAVDLAAVAESAVRVMRGDAEAAGLAIETTFPTGLPMVQADPLRVRQVLLNLLSNAVKFTEPGGRIAVAAGPAADGGLAVTITDSGIGMRADDIPRAFEPFTQLDNSLARRFPGSGLGLYLCRALATAQGAQVLIESTPTVGTCATLHFPPARVAPPG